MQKFNWAMEVEDTIGTALHRLDQKYGLTVWTGLIWLVEGPVLGCWKAVL
jgi:hypothetical protein